MTHSKIFIDRMGGTKVDYRTTWGKDIKAKMVDIERNRSLINEAADGWDISPILASLRVKDLLLFLDPTKYDYR